MQMTAKRARFIINLTTSKWLPTIIGRRRFWHRLYDAAARYAIANRDEFN